MEMQIQGEERGDGISEWQVNGWGADEPSRRLVGEKSSLAPSLREGGGSGYGRRMRQRLYSSFLWSENILEVGKIARE